MRELADDPDVQVSAGLVVKVKRALVEEGYAVKVDLISGEYSQGEKSISVQVNELQINSVRGIDLAFEGCDENEISGRMPDGSTNTVRARIVRPEVFVLIKAFALDERTKMKDAYDIAFVLHHYEPIQRAAYEDAQELFRLVDGRRH